MLSPNGNAKVCSFALYCIIRFSDFAERCGSLNIFSCIVDFGLPQLQGGSSKLIRIWIWVISTPGVISCEEDLYPIHYFVKSSKLYNLFYSHKFLRA